jgi:glycosidase
MLAAVLAAAFVLSGCFDVPRNDDPEITSEVDDWRDEVIYQVVVDRFANGDKGNDYRVDLQSPTGWHGGDWQGLIDRLDYLEEMGVTTLWISPVVENVEEDAGIAGYHGYWTQDFEETNPHFGNLDQLRALVAEAHKRDMKVILDIVTNHIGQLFYYDINKNGQADILLEGSGRDFEEFEGMRSQVERVTEWDPDFDPRGIQSRTSLGESGLAPLEWVYMPEVNRVPPEPEVFQNPDWYHRKGRVITPWGWNFEEQVERGDFPGGLKDIKTTLPEVRQEMIRIFSDWIRKTNVDGFRIDTVKHVEEEFWEVFAAGVRERAAEMGKENFLMFGEVFDGDDARIGKYTRSGRLDSVFYFSHKYQVFDDVFKREMPTKRIEDLYNQRFQNYGLEGHPGGVTAANGESLAPTQVLVNFMDNHDVPRFMWRFGEQDALHAGLIYLLTMDGIPCIYYGTEQGFDGGNDPSNREDMWESGFDRNHPTYRHIRKLTKLRRDYAPLRRGDFQIRWVTERSGNAQDAGIVAFERAYNGEVVLVVVNASSSKVSETSASQIGGGDMQVSFPAGTTLQNVWEDEDDRDSFTVSADGTVRVVVPPRSAKILVAR